MQAPAPGASVPGVQADAEPELEPEPDAGDGGAGPLAALTAIAQAPGTRTARVHTLNNGLTVIALRRPGLPFVAMRLGFHADPQPGEAPGARNVIDTSLRWDLPVGPLERGVLRSIERSPDSLQESLTMLSRNADQALDLLSDEADSLRLTWPNPRFERWADAAARTEATADDRALRAFRTALLGDHAYHLASDDRPGPQGHRSERRELARARAPARQRRTGDRRRHRSGGRRTQRRQRAKRLEGRRIAATPAPAPPVAPPLPPGAATPNVVHVEDPSRASVALRFGCILPPVRSPRDELVHDMLANMIQGELFDRLRLKMAVSYAPNVDAVALRGGSAWMEGTVDVDGKAAPQALTIVRGWFDPAQPFMIDPRGFERLRWQKARSSALVERHQRRGGRAIFHAWNMGWAPAVLDDYPRDLAAITLNDVTAAFNACRARSVITVLAAAPIAYN